MNRTFQTLLCGLLGLTPSNGVLPQGSDDQKKLVESAKET